MGVKRIHGYEEIILWICEYEGDSWVACDPDGLGGNLLTADRELILPSSEIQNNASYYWEP